MVLTVPYIFLHGKRQRLQMKIDKRLYTKKNIKLKREKQQRKIESPAPKLKLTNAQQINILCLKHGS